MQFILKSSILSRPIAFCNTTAHLPIWNHIASAPFIDSCGVRFKSSTKNNTRRDSKKQKPYDHKTNSKKPHSPKKFSKPPRKLTEPLSKFPTYLINNPEAKHKFLKSQGLKTSDRADDPPPKIYHPDELQEEIIDSSTPRPPRERPEPTPRRESRRSRAVRDFPKDKPQFGITSPLKFKKEEKEERKPKKESKPKKEIVVETKDTNKVEDAIVNVPDKIVVKASENDMRLDRLLGKRFPHLPNSLIQRFMREKKILVENNNEELEEEDSVENSEEYSKLRKAKASEHVYEGQTVYLKLKNIKMGVQSEKIDHVSEQDMEKFKSLILYRDRYIIAINKPSGLACQGGSGVKDHVDRYLSHLKSADGEETAKLAHRLDKDTSGVLLIARTRGVAIKLQEMFRGHKDVTKTYWAFVNGKPDPALGKIKVPLEKIMQNGEEKVVVRPDLEGKAKVAICDYKTLYPSESGSLVAMYPKTGRTHQLRVMCASVLRTPIVGDPKYGERESVHSLYYNVSLHLHARKLAFTHPETKESMEIVAPLPKHMKKTLSELSLGENFAD